LGLLSGSPLGSLGNTRSVHVNDPANDHGNASLKDTATNTDANNPTGGLLGNGPLDFPGNARSVHANDLPNDRGDHSLKNTDTDIDANNPLTGLNPNDDEKGTTPITHRSVDANLYSRSLQHCIKGGPKSQNRWNQSAWLKQQTSYLLVVARV